MDNKIISPDHPDYGLTVDYDLYTKKLYHIHKILATIIELEVLKRDPEFKKLLGKNKIYQADVKTIKQLKEALDDVYKAFMQVKESFDQSGLANQEAQNPS